MDDKNDVSAPEEKDNALTDEQKKYIKALIKEFRWELAGILLLLFNFSLITFIHVNVWSGISVIACIYVFSYRIFWK